MSYKPESYTSVAPYLVVEDAMVTLDFVKAVFGSDPLLIHRHDSGAIKHAEARIDDTVIMVGQMPGGPSANIHVYLPDIDEAFARAIQAGATVIQPVTDIQGEGNRRGGVRDPGGTVWWLSCRQAG